MSRAKPTTPALAARALPVLLLLVGGRAGAQVPERAKNLQVLPKGILRQELIQMMRGFSFSLGVRCQHCHATASIDAKAPPGSEPELDFASDAKETKQTARAMLRMVAAINQQYLAALPSPATIKVDCVTCHRGIPRPQAINDALAETLTRKDAPAAVALYRDLRHKFYGGAAYDFSETPLNRLGEALVAQNKGKDAAAIMELNAELNTLTVWGMHVLANTHLAAGETEKAKGDYRKILERDRNDSWARKQLEKLQRAK